MKKIFLPAIVAIAPIHDGNTINEVFNNADFVQNSTESKEVKSDKRILGEYKKKKLKKSEIKEKVISMVSKLLGAKKTDITEMTKLADLGADSLDVVEIIMQCEEDFSLSIPDIVAEQISSVGDCVDFIYETLQKSVLIFADSKFKGQVMHIVSNYTMYGSGSEFSSIIVPKGYHVILFSEQNYKGDKIIIDASKKTIKIKRFSKIKKNRRISINGNLKDWDNKIESIIVKEIQ